MDHFAAERFPAGALRNGLLLRPAFFFAIFA